MLMVSIYGTLNIRYKAGRRFRYSQFEYRGAGRGFLEHDPKSGNRFSEKIMLQQ